LNLASARSPIIEQAKHPALHPGISAKIVSAGETVGWLGSLHPKLQKTLDLSEAPLLFEIDMDVLDQSRIPVYTEVSKFPMVRRDLAFTIDENVAYSAIVDCVNQHASSLVTDVRLLDVYAGKGITDGLRSIALGLILQDFSSTLDDNEIETTVAQIIDGLNNDLGASLRK